MSLILLDVHIGLDACSYVVALTLIAHCAVTTSSNDSDRSPSHSRGDGYSPLGFRDSFGSDSADSGDGLGLGSLSIPIPESKMEEG